MIEYVDPEFFKAFDHYKAMREQYGEHHPITEQALILTMHYTPEHIKAISAVVAGKPARQPKQKTHQFYLSGLEAFGLEW